MPKLTEEQKASFANMTPAELIAKLDAQHEITDRSQARAEAAEGKLVAAEKKATEDAEAARLSNASDAEKERARAEKAEKQAKDNAEALKTERTKNALRLAARDAGVSAENVDDVMKLMGTDGLELDEHGTPTNAQDAIVAFLEKKPHFKGKNTWEAGDEEEGESGASHGAGAKGNPAVKKVKGSVIDTWSPEKKLDFYKKGGVRTDG